MKEYNFAQHLKSLKILLTHSVIAFVICFVIAFYYSELLLKFILEPLLIIFAQDPLERKIIFTNLIEAFACILKLSVYAALICASPYILLRLYLYLREALFPAERKILLGVLIAAPILFLTGAGLAYKVVLPNAWRFFLSFEQNFGDIPLVLEAKIGEYVVLFVQLILVFALIFQTPILILILKLLNLINEDILRKNRRFVIVGVFIMAGFLTPPDIFSQFALAIPMLLLYEISIVLCKFVKIKEGRDA